MPLKMRHAMVVPIFQKSHLNSEELKNYIPLSNLFYLSKLTVKVAAGRLISHH